MTLASKALTIDQLKGVWRRDWLRTKSASDDSTRVFWMQSCNSFVDIRIPSDRPDITQYECLADLDARTLLQLTQAEGFAGHIELEGDKCTWHREINWHGQTDSIDAGKLRLDECGNKLLEDGIHADYKEQWQRLPEGDCKALRINNATMRGFLLLSDSLFILGIGTVDAPGTAPLINSLQKGVVPASAQQLFSSQYCFGHWDGDEGVAILSTNPFCETKPVLVCGDNTIHWTQYMFDGTQLSHWF